MNISFQTNVISIRTCSLSFWLITKIAGLKEKKMRQPLLYADQKSVKTNTIRFLFS